MLRTDNRGVARAFAEGRAAKNFNGQFYTDGEVLYSYGPHWPVAAWLRPSMGESRTVLHLNDDKRSVTTSKHTSLARNAIVNTYGFDGMTWKTAVHHANCGDMCRAVRGHAL